MQNYNFLFFLSGNLAEAEIPVSLDNIKALLESQSVTGVVFENAGRQKLAYPIGNHHFGYLFNSFLKIEPKNVANLKEKLGLESEIIRFMLNNQEEKKNISLAGLSAAASDREAKAHARREAAKHVPSKEATQPLEDAAVVGERTAEIKKEERKKSKIDLDDINKKIDEILQKDNFVV